VGKAILANLDLAHVTRIIQAQGLPRFTANTITDPSVLLSHLAQARRLGYTIDDIEAEEGVRCVGAPIFDHTQDVIAAVSVAGPAYRLPIEKLRRLGTRVRAAANEISASLGHRRRTTAAAGISG
jgi:IclR family transcriptional regulator, acetate operon repressor